MNREGIGAYVSFIYEGNSGGTDIDKRKGFIYPIRASQSYEDNKMIAFQVIFQCQPTTPQTAR